MTLAPARVPVERRSHPTAARVLTAVVLVALLTLVGVASVAVGAKDLALGDVVRLLVDADAAVADPDASYIVRDLRLPRTLVAVAVGAALAVAGALVQALTRNPLADTGILGVDAGAAFAVTLGVAFLGVNGITGYAWSAFCGALVMTIAVYLVGGRLGADPMRLVLAGLALGAVISGVTGMLTLGNPDAFDSMRHWLVGTLENRNLDHLVPLLPYLLVALVIAVSVTPSLNALALGDDLAHSHGVRVLRVRLLVVSAITLLSGTATAVYGPIGFGGLMVPHVIRWIVGPDQRWIVPLSALAGGVLLTSADVVGRVLVSPAEMPAGVVTAFVGAPVLIVLIRTRKRVSGL